MNIFTKLLICIVLVFSYVSTLHAQQAYQVTGKAWKALGQKNWQEVIKQADYADSRWGDRARQLNRELDGYPEGESARNFGVLNELATITLLKAQALEKNWEPEAAARVYEQVITDFKYGQCWDKKGWWWKPAETALDALNRIAPGEFASIGLDTPPLSPKLRLKGKKGIGYTLRHPDNPRDDPHHLGTWTENMPKVEALNPYWNYSWGKDLAPNQPRDIEFIPMAWGAYGVDRLERELEETVIPHIRSGRINRFMGFNEPDKPEQANIGYKRALKHWPALEALGIPLVSPACANPLGNKNDISNQGVPGTWMRDFMKVVEERNYRVDYIGAHWYGGASPSSFKRKMIEIYKRYGERPLIISEFSPADWTTKTPEGNRHSEADVLAFMKDVLPWMERQNWIAGYAWFCWRRQDPWGTSAALFENDGELTSLGRFYASVIPVRIIFD